jgi:hypothetical protein
VRARTRALSRPDRSPLRCFIDKIKLVPGRYNRVCSICTFARNGFLLDESIEMRRRQRERERERERERALGQNNFCRLYLRARTIARRTMMILEHARHARFASIKSTCYTPTSSCTLRRLRRPIRRKVESSRLNRRIIVILLLLRREIHKIEKPRKIARG